MSLGWFTLEYGCLSSFVPIPYFTPSQVGRESLGHSGLQSLSCVPLAGGAGAGEPLVDDD